MAWVCRILTKALVRGKWKRLGCKTASGRMCQSWSPHRRLLHPSQRGFPDQQCFLIGVFNVFFLWVFFFFFGLASHHAECYFPHQGSNTCPLHWKHGTLTSGPLGKSLPHSNFNWRKNLSFIGLFMFKPAQRHRGLLIIGLSASVCKGR